MKKLIVSTCLLAALFVAACNSKKDNEEPTKTVTSEGGGNVSTDSPSQMNNTPADNDADFANFAADGGMMEVQAGTLAQTKGTTSTVKNAGKMIATDHKKANDELKALAGRLNITLPASMSADHQAKYDALAAKSGTDFDKAFLDAMEDGHKETIRRFEEESNNGRQSELKQWATDKLPTLRHHLEMIQDAKKANKK